jgi:hypothetical protein
MTRMTLLAEVHHVSQADALFWIGVIIVVACLAAAGYAAYLARWIAALVLLLVAVVAAFLLL